MEPMGTLGVTGFKNNFLSFKNLIFKNKFFPQNSIFFNFHGKRRAQYFYKVK